MDLHKYVCANINDELLLAASMPVGALQDSAIPIAGYGSSNVGMMKHIYRRGLGYRYGRCMQVIAGIHLITRFLNNSGRNTSSSRAYG